MRTFELPIRKKNRLHEYDYSLPNAYFITICTYNRENFFWDNSAVEEAADSHLSAYGKIVYECIRNIPKHYPMISVDNFVVMPNHVHLLLCIHTDTCGRPMAAPTISTVINQTKGSISKQIGFSVWQKGFHDHIIRGRGDYKNIWDYIENNPLRWEEDTLYTP
ncbi:MAG: transposase [Clostridia bacterium]|nr:transposase [Clostridia bacterium]